MHNKDIYYTIRLLLRQWFNVIIKDPYIKYIFLYWWLEGLPVQFGLQLAVCCVGHNVLLATALSGDPTHIQHKICPFNTLSIWRSIWPT